MWSEEVLRALEEDELADGRIYQLREWLEFEYLIKFYS